MELKLTEIKSVWFALNGHPMDPTYTGLFKRNLTLKQRTIFKLINEQLKPFLGPCDESLLELQSKNKEIQDKIDALVLKYVTEELPKEKVKLEDLSTEDQEVAKDYRDAIIKNNEDYDKSLEEKVDVPIKKVKMSLIENYEIGDREYEDLKFILDLEN